MCFKADPGEAFKALPEAAPESSPLFFSFSSLATASVAFLAAAFVVRNTPCNETGVVRPFVAVLSNHASTSISTSGVSASWKSW